VKTWLTAPEAGAHAESFHPLTLTARKPEEKEKTERPEALRLDLKIGF
jgi:hypothetical protein